jgi:hypothetical protein
MNMTRKILLMTGGANPSFRLTCTTTGNATLTITDLTIATGKTVTVDWGDGTSNDYTGAGARTHAYTGAGARSVKMTKREDITALDLEDTKLSGTISAANPLPSKLASLVIKNAANIIYNINASPLPATLTYLNFRITSGITYNVNSNPLPPLLTYCNFDNVAGLTYNIDTTPLPTGITILVLTSLVGAVAAALVLPPTLTTLTINACANVVLTTWTINTLRAVVYKNSLSADQVNAALLAIWANKANYTYATPTIDISTTNAAPTGTYQEMNPPTTGNEAKYDLVNDVPAPGPAWAVTTT